MIQEAVDAHPAFSDCRLSVFAKGSYPNNTNVRGDSDVDVAVQCHECIYWGEHEPGAHPPSSGSYTGIWTPARLRSELESALRAKFPNQVDTSSSTAIQVNSTSSRVDADVVPCFNYEYHFKNTSPREGIKIFKKTSGSIENYPRQHLAEGRKKNSDTNQNFKKTVRILKRVENAMVEAGYHREVPSFLVECLVYNCPNSILTRMSWDSTIEEVLAHVWDHTQGDREPDKNRWVEVNDCQYLFHREQKWTRADARDFAKAAWNYLEYA